MWQYISNAWFVLGNPGSPTWKGVEVAFGAWWARTGAVVRHNQSFARNGFNIYENRAFWNVTCFENPGTSFLPRRKPLRERHRPQKAFVVSKRQWPFPGSYPTIRAIFYTKFNEISARSSWAWSQTPKFPKTCFFWTEITSARKVAGFSYTLKYEHKRKFVYGSMELHCFYAPKPPLLGDLFFWFLGKFWV